MDMATIPKHSVSYRIGSIASLEMVKVFEEAVSKRNVFPIPQVGSRHGTNLQTFLFVKCWVKNIAYTKNVWVDVHVFDGRDVLIDSETFTLSYLEPAGGGGNFFIFDAKIYQGSTGTPGSVSPKPGARKVQYRIYYDVNSQVFTDAIMRQHELQDDAVA
jgi:hypothetical protein